MKRTLIIIAFFIVFLFLYFLQSDFFSWYNIAGIKPNLFIVFTLFIGLFLRKIWGFSFGVIFGILLDLFIGKRIGINAVMLGIAGLVGGVIDKSFSKESRMTFVLMTIAVTILCEIINYTLQIILLGADATFTKFMQITIIESIYNAILVIILYPLIQKAGSKTEEVYMESKRKSLMKFY